MSLRDLRPLLAVTVVGVVVALAQTAGGLDAASLSLLPPVLLFLPLLAGRYVGEAGIERLARRVRVAPRRALRRTAAPRPRPRRRSGAGGLLLATRLAGRAPPHPSVLAAQR
jgi:hypothetical protein